jgi:hypothetical protein
VGIAKPAFPGIGRVPTKEKVTWEFKQSVLVGFIGEDNKYNKK